jgi:hypothetical protein
MFRHFPERKPPGATQNYLPICIGGGIGDMIMALPWIETFREYEIPLRIYATLPNVVRLFLDDLDVRAYDHHAEGADFYIQGSDVLNFKIKPGLTREAVPAVLRDLYEKWFLIYRDWQLYVDRHPHEGNAQAVRAVAMGLDRRSMPFLFLGKPYKPFIWKKADRLPAPGGVGRFITVHDGYDNNFSVGRGVTIQGRSMKSWSNQSWSDFVRRFKRKHKDVTVLQLGGTCDEPISGVDHNLIGKTSFYEALQYLKYSLVHVDTCSGLVHARHLFPGTKTVTIFGPTNWQYFGYPENINIAPSFCGNCWWLKSDWMKACVKGYEVPRCMDSTSPEAVLDAVGKILQT